MVIQCYFISILFSAVYEYKQCFFLPELHSNHSTLPWMWRQHIQSRHWRHYQHSCGVYENGPNQHEYCDIDYGTTFSSTCDHQVCHCPLPFIKPRTKDVYSCCRDATHSWNTLICSPDRNLHVFPCVMGRHVACLAMKEQDPNSPPPTRVVRLMAPPRAPVTTLKGTVQQLFPSSTPSQPPLLTFPQSLLDCQINIYIKLTLYNFLQISFLLFQELLQKSSLP